MARSLGASRFEAILLEGLARGEAQLTRACLTHNALRFRVAAAETCLLAGNTEQWLRSADQARGEKLKGVAREALQMGFVATMPRLLHDRFQAHG
ncbi:hypothetical protein PSH58_25750 [Pseudomonas hefeiensis]|uniref:Uncharacterized protein n=1 Tax=Pseudomonas hefeiensis TaxID=2738125 RepID=A0ABY9G9H5_9PSED|nr:MULTISPECIES: hypothetical protein [unclassified Pseudomonas]WLH12182.1 hypothetical protein PSH57_25735 [Pseudomonas sp. FP205]WLH95234.1 hypothetical protein PSH58_25750 [Pseudomonas sp. FP53]WLI39521.1 hypothetical protein PSH74_25750 [Pseudomonas sp. FP821]